MCRAGDECADAIRPKQTNAVFLRDLDALLFERRAFGADFTKPGRDNDRGFDPAPAAVFDGLRRGLRRDDENREVNGIRHILQIRVKRMPEQFPAFLADKVNRAFVSALN